MLVELTGSAMESALPLYAASAPSYSDLIVRALAEGNATGRLWADDAAAPSVALFWDGSHVCGVAGQPGEAVPLRGLIETLGREVAPPVQSGQRRWVKLSYTSAAWEPLIPRLFPGTRLKRMERRLLALRRAPQVGGGQAPPPDVELRWADAELLRPCCLPNARRVLEEVESCWPSLDRFLAQGFAVCTLIGEVVAGWCTVEYRAGTDIGLGVETVEEYQGRGLATLAASAVAARCLDLGLTPYWDAWSINTPSLRVAEKLGFEEVSRYHVHAGWLSPPQNA